jgi:hypothetical protein
LINLFYTFFIEASPLQRLAGHEITHGYASQENAPRHLPQRLLGRERTRLDL